MSKEGVIYCITNNINNKKYIGQTRRSLDRRWKEHCWVDNNQLITRAINKYGKENFSKEIIEKCNKHKLNDREIYWISFYDTFNGEGYNTHKGGLTLGEGEDHPRTGQKTPDEIKEKMRKTLKENGTLELRQGENHPYYGKTHSEEIREKMSRNISKAKRKKSKFSKKQSIKIIKEYFETNITQRKLANKYKTSITTIGKILKCKHWTTKDLAKSK